MDTEVEVDPINTGTNCGGYQVSSNVPDITVKQNNILLLIPPLTSLALWQLYQMLVG